MDKYRNLKMAVGVTFLYMVITTVLNFVNGLATNLFCHHSYAKSIYSINTVWFVISLLLIIVLFICSSVLKPYKCCTHTKYLIVSLILIVNGVIDLASDDFMFGRIFLYLTDPTNLLSNADVALGCSISLILIIIKVIIGVCLCVYSLRKNETKLESLSEIEGEAGKQ